MTTFKRIIQDDDYFDIFENYIEHIIHIFGNYFGTDHERFLDLIYEIINAINSPQLEGSKAEEEELKKKLEENDARLYDLHDAKSKAASDDNFEEQARLIAEIKIVNKLRQEIIDSQVFNDSQAHLPPRMETDDKVFLRCLHIFHGFFQSGKLKKEIDRLPTMINKLVSLLLFFSKSSYTIFIFSLKRFCLVCSQVTLKFAPFASRTWDSTVCLRLV